MNRFHGRGVYIWKDGKKYDGEWFEGMRVGQGITIMSNGEKHDGAYKANEMNGSGWWRFSSGKVRPGEWINGKLDRWTGPEQFEAQMKAKRALKQNSNQK